MKKTETSNRKRVIALLSGALVLSLSLALMAKSGGANKNGNGHTAHPGQGQGAQQSRGIGGGHEVAHVVQQRGHVIGGGHDVAHVTQQGRGARMRPEQANANAHPHTITSLTIEPATLCAGQTFLASVELASAATVSEVYVGGERGERVALLAGKPGPLEVTAVAYDLYGRPDTHSETVQVVECPDAPMITLEHRMSAAEQDAVLVEGTVVQGLEAPVTWTWSFGDGVEVETGDLARALHSYRLRPQNGQTSHFTIEARAKGAQGNVANAYLGVRMVNGEWALAQHDVWHMPASYDRFPTISEDVVKSQVSIRNLDATRSLSLAAVSIKETSCKDPTKITRTEHKLEKVLEIKEIPAGAVVSSALALPYDITSPACRWSVEIKGAFQDGTPASLNLALEQGAPAWAGRDVKLSRDEIKRAFRARVMANQRQVAGEQVRPVITP